MAQIGFNETPRIAAVNEPHLACVLLMDTSGSMYGCIDNLNQSINNFKNSVSMDELSRKRVDVAVVAFDDDTRVEMPFTPLAEMEPVCLSTGGCTEMGHAINVAIDMVKERNRFYQEMGTPCFKPWIFMITDGAPTDSIDAAAQRVHAEEAKGKLKFFVVGVDDYDKNLMFTITNRVMELRSTDFTGIFNWLSESMVTISVSKPSDEAKLGMLPVDARRADPDRDISDW
ncbi:MAG: VWA domain-containing protein [Candidatus Methanomethylophilaceae archaeon]